MAKLEEATDSAREAQAANVFDLRRILGGMFLLYGALLTVLGIFDNAEEVEKAAGVRINLWAGLAMLVVGALFIAWALWRPLAKQIEEEERARAAQESGGAGGSA
ncbi:MAG TPA: hypothetical protein VN238_04490 [Solirubrobacteraceae bacterium]|nr:hypothetical protein [Solirubrobacteraceae bacterium]